MTLTMHAAGRRIVAAGGWVRELDRLPPDQIEQREPPDESLRLGQVHNRTFAKIARASTSPDVVTSVNRRRYDRSQVFVRNLRVICPVPVAVESG